jgi:CheY-specific phosphatase CheX
VDDFVQRLDVFAHEATLGLFEANGVVLEPLTNAPTIPPREHDISASIGFASPQIRGAFTLTTRQSLVRKAWPHELQGREPTDAELADWTGELANQWLGRLKERLLPLGVVLAQGTPSVVRGWRLHRSSATTTIARIYAFRIDDEELLLYLDVEMMTRVTLTHDEGLAGATAGNVVLFDS